MNNTELNFKFTVDETNYILASLSKMPYEQVVNFLEKIKKQASEQLNIQPVNGD